MIIKGKRYKSGDLRQQKRRENSWIFSTNCPANRWCSISLLFDRFSNQLKITDIFNFQLSIFNYKSSMPPREAMHSADGAGLWPVPMIIKGKRHKSGDLRQQKRRENSGIFSTNCPANICCIVSPPFDRLRGHPSTGLGSINLDHSGLSINPCPLYLITCPWLHVPSLCLYY